MALQKGLGAGEDVENLLLGGVHPATVRQGGEKTKSFFKARHACAWKEAAARARGRRAIAREADLHILAAC
jgi:hypothetical protein